MDEERRNSAGSLKEISAAYAKHMPAVPGVTIILYFASRMSRMLNAAMKEDAPTDVAANMVTRSIDAPAWKEIEKSLCFCRKAAVKASTRPKARIDSSPMRKEE